MRIESIGPRHADAVQRLATDARIAATTKVPHPYPADGARTWIAAATAECERGTMYAFAIVDERGECVGPCSLMAVDRAARVAELGYWIGVPYWGRGLATAGARQVLAFGFETLGLERIVADCLDHNTASRRVLEKLGFVPVGPAGTDDRGASSRHELRRNAGKEGRA